MKKVLYTTTALAAAGMFAFSGADAVAAEKVKLGLGGYFIWAAGASDSEAKSHDSHSGINMITDSEIYFRGNTTLDNGIRFDVIVQLESDDVNSTTIDESYLKVGNLKQWGEFRLGTTKQAHFLFRAMGPHVSTIVNATNNDVSDFFVPSTTKTKFFSHEGGADRMLAAYITPNINGFQGGISYTPSQENKNSPPMTKGMMATEAKNVSLGGNYKGKFGDASIAISGGYTAVDGGKADSITGARTGEADYTTTQAGLKVSFAGFSIGGHWAERKDDVADSTTDDIEGFMAGVGYKTGPWNLALTWLNTTDDQTMAAGEDESNQYLLGMTYALGAGITAGASVFSVDFQDEGTGEMAKNNEGWGALGGVKVAF